MPDFPQFALYTAAALLLAITPGPGIFYVAARTLAGGRAEGIASSFGTGLGGMIHVLAGAFGISAVILASAELFTLMKYAGAAYLIWLGYRTWRDAGSLSPDPGLQLRLRQGIAKAFREGILVEALNPKTAAFFLAFVPQFVDVSKGSVLLQFILLGAISVALNTLADIVVAFGAGRVANGATASVNRIKRVRQASGGAMIVLGAGLALTRRAAD